MEIVRSCTGKIGNGKRPIFKECKIVKNNINFEYLGITPLKKTNRNVLLGVIFLCYTIFLAVFFHQDIIYGKISGIVGNEPDYPMLLNSKMADTQEVAELRIVLWFEQGKPQKDFTKDLPQKDWLWQESPKIDNGGISAYSLAGHTTLKADTEREVFAWYRDLEKEVRKYGGIAYLDERVQEAIDIAQYAVRSNIIPQQFSLAAGTISVVGWHRNISPQVQAGEELVNIQLISQGYEGKGRTALAIPVLLEEF